MKLNEIKLNETKRNETKCSGERARRAHHSIVTTLSLLLPQRTSTGDAWRMS
jgi:hypothetical protein